MLFLGFPGGSDGKNLPAVQETWVQSLGQEEPIPWLSPGGEGNSNPLQYPCLLNL